MAHYLQTMHDQLMKRNGFVTSAFDPVSVLTPVSLQTSFNFVTDKIDSGHGDHVIQSSANDVIRTSFLLRCKNQHVLQDCSTPLIDHHA